MTRADSGGRRALVLATVTPLASIFGSGFLIIVPILERALGALAPVGIAGVCALAWALGIAIRHNVAHVEPQADAGRLDPATRRLERASDAAIVVAYVISIALYLRILAQFAVDYASSGSPATEKVVAVVLVGVITLVGVVRGLDGLELLERVALGLVLVLVVVLVTAFAYEDAVRLADGSFRLPPVPATDLGSVLLILGGVVITVQGFETVRYLQPVPRETRIAASRVAQLTASVVYIAVVALAIPLAGLGTSAGADRDLLGLVERVTPVLALPLVITAVLSQLSAATADTEAGVGNLRVLDLGPLRGRAAYLGIGAAAAVLAATLSTSLIVVVASRGFAAYYALQCVVALRTSERRAGRAGFGVLALLMLAVTVLAKPAS